RRVDTAIAQSASEQRLAEAAVSAGEIEDVVARLELPPERDDQVRAVGEVRADVGVRPLGPVGRLPCVLVLLGGHSASRRSGCFRTKRAIPRACQSVCRERNRWSITAAYACVTMASGTYHRSHPACAAR